MKDGEIRRALDGAWEERGVVGSRIEIKKDKLTVLWRGGVVLKTKFKAQQCGEVITLRLAQNGMRYNGAPSDYATVTDIHYDGGVLFFEEDFPITGKSVTKMEKTENSCYGNVDIVDGEVLKRLRGEWHDDGYHKIVFKGDTLEMNGEKIKIHVVKYKSSNDPYRVIDTDPSKDCVGYFYRMEYLGDTIAAHLMVCDAPPVVYTFRKVK
ncbi:MAG: hypothetical protein IKP68_02215 [Clostridia bacterium]|nr:hypothetical protein [Clostridia bacterium]